MTERAVLYAALAIYAAGWGCVLWRGRRPLGDERLALWLLGAGVVLHTLALVLRWRALGHGPFTTMYEVLGSSLWSLTLVLVIAAGALRAARAALPGAIPVLALLALWLLFSDPRPGHMPPTYATPLLYLHALAGKLFLGLLLVAVALAAVGRRCNELAFRFAAGAFIADTLLLIIGAAWAQDAWGRYWAWDPLESWAFLTWLALATALHVRATLQPSVRAQALWLGGVFMLAFLTFFGVPFLAAVPHQGAL
jgi:ABC-type transport system involved in cytochrome c biogenesis permease subunit